MQPKHKHCNLCMRDMKPLFGNAAYLCKCGNAYISGKGYIRLQSDEELYMQKAIVHGKPVFYPEIKKNVDPEPENPKELILYVKPDEWTASGRYQRNANEILYGGIYYVEFSSDFSGSEIQKSRPCIVISHVQQTQYISIVTVIPITSRVHEDTKTHVAITSTGKPATALVEQITTVDVTRVGDYMGQTSVGEMMKLKKAMQMYLGITEPSQNSARDDLANLEAENYALNTQLKELTDEVTRLRKARIRWEEEKCLLMQKQG